MVVDASQVRRTTPPGRLVAAFWRGAMTYSAPTKFVGLLATAMKLAAVAWMVRPLTTDRANSTAAGTIPAPASPPTNLRELPRMYGP